MTSVGFIGLGTMGEPIARNLVASGLPLTIWNRSSAPVERLVALGARAASSPGQLIESCEIVCVMLIDETALDEVLGRGAGGLDAFAGKTLVQLATTSPEYSAALGRDVLAAGGRYVEAPVSGSRLPAEAGELIGMLAGSPADVDRVEPLLAPACARIVRCGAVPAAMTTKLVVNHFLITMVSTLTETYLLAQRAGVDVEIVRDILDAGPMASAVSRAKLAKLSAGDLTAHSRLDNVRWLTERITDIALRARVPTPSLDISRRLLAETEARGHGALDPIAVIDTLAEWGQLPASRDVGGGVVPDSSLGARSAADVSAWFRLASAGFQAVVRELTEECLDQPGLGIWSVRDLLGHTTRAYLTIESYLAAPESDAPWIASATDYFAAARRATDASSVAARGVAAGVELGAHPGDMALTIARRVEELVTASSGDETVSTPFGQMRLADYLATRALELTVHSADLARALGTDLPAETRAASVPALRLCAELATDATAAEALAALTGRPLTGTLSVL